MYEVLRVQYIFINKSRFAYANRAFIIGGWSTGMIGVSKTFGGGSIPSPPVKTRDMQSVSLVFINPLII